MNTVIFTSVQDANFQHNPNIPNSMMNAINLFVHLTSANSKVDYQRMSSFANESEISDQAHELCMNLLLDDLTTIAIQEKLINNFDNFNEYWLGKDCCYWEDSIESALVALTLNVVDQQFVNLYVSNAQTPDPTTTTLLTAYSKFKSVVSELNEVL